MSNRLTQADFRGDFRVFLKFLWDHLNLPSPTPVQNDIAAYLQTGPKRLGIEAFRGVGKSFITSAFAIWELMGDYDKRIMVVSASKERALAFSHFTKRLIYEIPLLNFMIPGEGQRNSAEVFDIGPSSSDHSPSIKSVGITGQLTGSRADLIICDDGETPKNSFTQTARDRLAVLCTEFEAIIKPLPTSRIVYLGTPQCEDSLYNKLAQKGYEFRIWPVLFPTDKEIIQYRGQLAPWILDKRTPENIGTTVEPSRFDMDDLASREMSYGKAGFALQFMLNTSLSDRERFPLRCSDFVVMDVGRNRGPIEVNWGSGIDSVLQELPCAGLAGDRFHKPYWTSSDEMQEYGGKVLAVDPSGRGKDETGYAVGYFLNGNVFIPELGGIQGGSDEETIDKLLFIAKRHKVNAIVVEENFGSGMYAQIMRSRAPLIYPVTIEDEKVGGQKERRIIDTLEPVMGAHRLILDPSVILKDNEKMDTTKTLVYQLTRMTYDKGAVKHDDIVDCLALLVQYWNDQMTADDTRMAESVRDNLMEKEMSKFYSLFGKSETQTRNWLD